MRDVPLIDDFRPVSLLCPASVAELGTIVRRAAAEGHALYPVGGGTMLHLGNPPTKPGHAADMTGLDRVIDYPARDMTITVQAGITIAKLEEILAKENQRLPVDVPHPERATLGGAIAVNASGPRRYGYGTLRDYVIGISFMDDNGNEVKSGGRVVKNVAGYDLCKLQIGALGTLGIITQVTLKLVPLPQETRVVKTTCQIGELSYLLSCVHSTQTRPVAVDIRPNANGLGLVIGFEGTGEAVEWQVNQLQKELQRPEQSEVVSGKAAAVDFTWGPTALTDRFGFLTLRACVLPSVSAEYVASFVGKPECYWQARAGNGVVTLLHGELALEEARHFVAELRERAKVGKGSVVITRCPPEWKRELKVWGEPCGDWALMRKIKREIDPHDLFNPGRFVV
jgi:glycolate oxidase FAD binding subunit